MDFNDLVKRDDVYYKKFTDVPFTGEVTGKGQGTLRDGIRVGHWITNHRNGRVMSIGTYKDGHRDGHWITNHTNGRLMFIGTYKDGDQEGPWVYYHKNGQLRLKGTFKDGRKTGPWVFYEPDGRINETAAAWRHVLDDLLARGLKGIRGIGDGRTTIRGLR